MSKKLFVILPLLIVPTACHSYGTVRVNSYWGTTIERPALGSVYDWSAGSGHLEPGQDQRISAAVQEDAERELAAMGFVKREGTQQADYLFSLHTGRGLQPSPSGPEQRANLAVRVLAASDGHLIYCASADALIDPMLSPEVRRTRIDFAVSEILRPLNPCPHCASCRHHSNCTHH